MSSYLKRCDIFVNKNNLIGRYEATHCGAFTSLLLFVIALFLVQDSISHNEFIEQYN